MLAFTALIPIESSACTQSEEQNDDSNNSNNYYTKDINGETFRVYPDGKYLSEEDSSDCFFINPEAGTTYECEDKNRDRPLGSDILHGKQNVH